MAKRDITTEALLTWDEYKDKPAALALPSIYAHASATAATISGWYWAAIRTKRRTSLGVRFVTFVLLIAGTVLPLLSGLENAVELRLRFTQCGIAAVAAGGLLQVADRVFGWSSGWIRYVTTVTAMENLTRKFELDWAGYVLGRGGVLTDADAKPLFDIAEALELALRHLQAEETEKWAVEFNSGTALLNDLIKQQRETGERVKLAVRAAVDAHQAAAHAAGAVEITLVHAAAPTPVTIAIDTLPAEAFTGTVWSRLNLAAGQHTVTLRTGAGVVTKVIDVPAGGAARLEIPVQ